MHRADKAAPRLLRRDDRARLASGKARRSRLAAAIQWVGRIHGAIAARLSRDARGSLLPELIAVGCLLIVPWLGIAVTLRYAHRNIEAAAVQSTGALTKALEESTRRTIGQIDYVLLSARAMRAAEGDRFDFHAWVRTQTLADKMTAQIAMADRSGLVVSSTTPLLPGLSVADRVHFRAQVDPAHDDLFISEPVLGRVSGVQTIQFSRKVLDPDGTFAGVVVLSLGTVEMARFYQALGLGDGFVSILSADGTILSRGPWVPGLIGTSVRANAAFSDVLKDASGSVRLDDGPAQAAQIASFRHLSEYPLIVMVGFGTDTVLAPYRSLRDNALLGGTAASLAFGLLGLFWIRQKRRSMLAHRDLTVTLDSISQGILMVDSRGAVSFINRRVLSLLALPDETPGTSMLFAASRAAELVPWAIGLNSVANAAMQAGEPVGHGKYETTLDNGTIIEVRTHVLADGGFVQTYSDVTEQRTAHAKVEHLAHHDALTGLANRVALRQRLSAIIGRNGGADSVTALLMIDLDGFKGVNDTLGHDVGDMLLAEVARRLKSLVRGTDVVARLGGDEFVVLVANLAQPEDIVPLAKRVLLRLAEPVQLNAQQVRIGASIGISFHPADALDIDALFKHADVALYSAKTAGRGVYRCFDERLTQAMTDHGLLEADLRAALDADALEVHFQPKFDAVSLRIVGFEALARWRHPTRGYVPPDVFIPLAEGAGLIGRLGNRILEKACTGLATWQPRLPVAVNVSVIQLHVSGLKDEIAALLERVGIGPEMLELEVTESVLADDDRTVLANLQALRAMGIGIALDDFGTGYSSLSYLRRFTFDRIKIDKSFVQGQADDPRVRIILEAILGMCRDLGVATIAEGVETLQQLEQLRDRGCSEVQGYLLAHPMPGDQVQAFMRSHAPSSVGHKVLDAVQDPESLDR